MQKVTDQKGNGLEAARTQPAGTFTKRTTDFIARCARIATVNAEMNILFLLLAFQFVVIVWGVL